MPSTITIKPKISDPAILCRVQESELGGSRGVWMEERDVALVIRIDAEQLYLLGTKALRTSSCELDATQHGVTSRVPWLRRLATPVTDEHGEIQRSELH